MSRLDRKLRNFPFVLHWWEIALGLVLGLLFGWLVLDRPGLWFFL